MKFTIIAFELFTQKKQDLARLSPYPQPKNDLKKAKNNNKNKVL